MVTLKHQSGASAEVYLFGATLTSYKTPDGKERIFVSPGAIFDGKKAIRGGVPVVFPQFGQPDKAMAQHGFARSSVWSFESVTEGIDQSRLVLSLRDNDETRAKWPHQFALRFIVELSAVSLKMSLEISNTGAASFKFHALLHTYFSVPAIDDIGVSGLGGKTFLDKVDGGKSKLQDTPVIHLPSFTDRVYIGEGAGDADASIGTKDGRVLDWVSNSATVAGAARPCDVVVWNPYEEASPGDLPPPAFKGFVCVEPGLVADFHELQPTQVAVVSQKVLPA
jgi:glucose-6-phosphate 1-epimerase